jgi:hypothetical protein
MTPSSLLVVRVLPGVLTPRSVMQLCSASITTPTPAGWRMSWIASATSAVSFSWICSRPVGRQIADVGPPDHGQHVVLAEADHPNVPKHHQFVIAADLLEGALEILAGFGVIAGEQFPV